MKKLSPFVIALAASLALIVTAHAKRNIVATLPDFGALARETGGDKVDVTVLA